MVQWFCVTSWRLFDVWTFCFGIMGQYDRMFDLKINVGLYDLYFMVQWICLISQRQFVAWVSYIQIMKQCDPNFYLKVNISQHDLYFVVYWFCLISSRLFDGWTSKLVKWISVTHRLTVSSICRSVTYILWCSDFASYHTSWCRNVFFLCSAQ